jgi:hypothetical protein
MTVAADITTRPRSYRACSIKRDRRTKAEIDDIKAAIVAALKGDHPMTVRQVFYRLVVQKVIEKTEKEYQQTVIRLLTEMRLSGRIGSTGSSMKVARASSIAPMTASPTRLATRRDFIAATRSGNARTTWKFGARSKPSQASSAM